MSLRVIEYRQLTQILVMFMIVQFFGILLATQMFDGVPMIDITGVQIISGAFDVFFYIAEIILFTVVLLILFKVFKGPILFRILEAVVVFISASVVMLIVYGIPNGSALQNIYGDGQPIAYFVAFAAALALIVAKNRWPWLRNTTAMIASVGVGVVLGVTFPFIVAYAFMVLLAVYDYVAVFVTKHMITMAKAMSSMNLSFLVGVNEVEAVSQSSLSKEELSEYKKEMRGIKNKSPMLKHIVENRMVPMAAHVELGTGDLGVPLMVAVSAYSVSSSFMLSLFIAVGATGGLILTMYILRKYKRALPAIPPLLAGITVALVVYFLVYGVI